ncbi:hypothetical protein F4703DRAFT_1934092 [Phycomyces blakesleeanus]
MATDNRTFVRTICKTERVPAMFDGPSSSASTATTNLNSNNGSAPMEFVIENPQDIYSHEISDKDEYSADQILFDSLDDYDETTALQKLYDFIE